MRVINPVGQSVVKYRKPYIVRKLNIRIQPLFQRCAATGHQASSFRTSASPRASQIYNFRWWRLGVIRIQLCNSSDFSSFLLWMTCFETSLYAAVGLNNRGSTVRRKFYHLLLGWVQGCLYLAGRHGEGWWVSWTWGQSTAGTDQTLLLFSVSSQHEVGAAGRLAAHGGCWEYLCARRCPGCTNGTGMVWRFQQRQWFKTGPGWCFWMPVLWRHSFSAQPWAPARGAGSLHQLLSSQGSG